MEYYYFTGKVLFAQTAKLDKFGKYSVTLVLSKDDIAKYNRSGIQKSLKGTDEGPTVTFTRTPTRVNQKTQEVQDFGLVSIVDKNGEPTDLYLLKGDEVVCKVAVYDTQKGKGSTLESVLLLHKEGNYEDQSAKADPEYQGVRF